MGKITTTETPRETGLPTWLELERYVREQMQAILEQLLEAEVTEFLGRVKHARRAGTAVPGGYRNGYGKPRRGALLGGTIEVRRPRLRDLSARFESRVLQTEWRSVAPGRGGRRAVPRRQPSPRSSHRATGGSLIMMRFAHLLHQSRLIEGGGMQRVVCPLVTMLVMVLVGRPVLGQVQTAPPAWADSVVGTWTGERDVDPEVIVLRSDSTVLVGGYRRMAFDTLVWFRKNRWSVMKYDAALINIRMGREADEQDHESYSGRACVVKGHSFGSSLFGRVVCGVGKRNSGWFGLLFKSHVYKRVGPAAVPVNRLHPRPVPAPTGTLAQLLGTWERQDSISKDGRSAISRSTIRPDSTVVKTVLWMQGTDTVSAETHLETVLVSGDTLWWGGWFDPNTKPRRIGRGRTVVVQDDQLTLFKVETPTVPDQVYKRVASPTPP